MIITEKRLRRVIREELRLISEGGEELQQGAKDDIDEVVAQLKVNVGQSGDMLKTIFEQNEDIYEWLKGDKDIHQLAQDTQDHLDQLPDLVMTGIQNIRDNFALVFKMMPTKVIARALSNLWK